MLIRLSGTWDQFLFSPVNAVLTFQVCSQSSASLIKGDSHQVPSTYTKWLKCKPADPPLIYMMIYSIYTLSAIVELLTSVVAEQAIITSHVWDLIKMHTFVCDSCKTCVEQMKPREWLGRSRNFRNMERWKISHLNILRAFFFLHGFVHQ